VVGVCTRGRCRLRVTCEGAGTALFCTAAALCVAARGGMVCVACCSPLPCVLGACEAPATQFRMACCCCWSFGCVAVMQQAGWAAGGWTLLLHAPAPPRVVPGAGMPTILVCPSAFCGWEGLVCGKRPGLGPGCCWLVVVEQRSPGCQGMSRCDCACRPDRQFCRRPAARHPCRGARPMVVAALANHGSGLLAWFACKAIQTLCALALTCRPWRVAVWERVACHGARLHPCCLQGGVHARRSMHRAGGAANGPVLRVS
jgi:hypothetical protein